MIRHVATATLLVLSIAAALWTAAKVFRIGVLLTGQPPILKEILLWIRAPVGMEPLRIEFVPEFRKALRALLVGLERTN